MFSINNSNSNNNDNTTNNSNSNSKNSRNSALYSLEKCRLTLCPSSVSGGEGDEENTSVCSSVSSLTDEEEATPPPPAAATTTTTALNKKKRHRFTITKATNNNTARANPTTQTSPASDAVSISFLSGNNGANTKQPTTRPSQVIQKALAGLRPGGVFFVLDYKDDNATAASSAIASTTKLSPGTPQSCPSLAMKEIPQDLVEQWNLTMVPTNLETFYNTKLKQPSSKPAPARSSLPASKRIVRWMGIKPSSTRQNQVSPSN